MPHQASPSRAVVHEAGYTPNGQFVARWGISAPWAHAIWSQYMVVLFDLRAHEGQDDPVRYDPEVTHEFHVFVLDPAKPLDFGRAVKEQDVVTLSPSNMAYQFTALSDRAATNRLHECVRMIQEVVLSPDTDHRSQWDSLFHDGVSLIRSAIAEVTARQGKSLH